MKNFSFKIAANIINMQMNKQTPNCSAIMSESNGYKFMLLDKSGRKISGDNIDKDALTITDKSPLGHLGVWSIVVADTSFASLKREILFKSVAGFLVAYFIVALLGYYLIKLLLKPIKEARERIDNFVKDTTHELNTPITALLMCANKDALQNPKNIERIEVSAKRISELYKDLTYIFLEDKSKRKVEEFNLQELIEQQLPYFLLLANKKRITVSLDLEETIVQMDREDCKRLFSNLLSNSIKYNRRGGVITISLHKRELLIRDSGIGIEQAKIDRVFERYFRATDESGGFGIGLSIVEEICKRYGITVTVNSNSGVGTTFRLLFPPY